MALGQLPSSPKEMTESSIRDLRSLVGGCTYHAQHENGSSGSLVQDYLRKET